MREFESALLHPRSKPGTNLEEGLKKQNLCLNISFKIAREIQDRIKLCRDSQSLEIWWWENKAPYDSIKGATLWRTMAGRGHIVRRINSRSAILPSRKPAPSLGTSGKIAKGRGAERGERSNLSLSLSPRLFINALIRGELLERWCISPKREERYTSPSLDASHSLVPLY